MQGAATAHEQRNWQSRLSYAASSASEKDGCSGQLGARGERCRWQCRERVSESSLRERQADAKTSAGGASAHEEPSKPTERPAARSAEAIWAAADADGEIDFGEFCILAAKPDG